MVKPECDRGGRCRADILTILIAAHGPLFPLAGERRGGGAGLGIDLGAGAGVVEGGETAILSSRADTSNGKCGVDSGCFSVRKHGFLCFPIAGRVKGLLAFRYEVS